MKYVAVDLGNTRGKLAVFEDHVLVAQAKDQPNELIAFIKKVNPHSLILCSVTQSAADLGQLFSEFPSKIILDPDTPLPIKNGYSTPQTLGYDRLAAAAQAHFLFPDEHCLIIDLGTAIKYDFVDNQGVFRGGIISPGMQMRFRALHTFTSKLPLIEAKDIPPLIGDSTETCMQSGVINGIAAEINGIVERYSRQANLKILLSGGDASFFESQINYPTFAHPNLVLEGLYRILIYNVENKDSFK